MTTADIINVYYYYLKHPWMWREDPDLRAIIGQYNAQEHVLDVPHMVQE